MHTLAALTAAEGSKKILPVWHGMDHKDIAQFSPLVADVLGANAADGIEAFAEQIAGVLDCKVAS